MPPTKQERREFMRGFQERFPTFRTAFLADTRMFCAGRGERHDFRNGADAVLQGIRLLWVSDAFFAFEAYRLKAALQAKGVPVIPRILHRLAMGVGQVCIGDPVVIHPGVYLPHGQVVIDGIVEIKEHVSIRPWVTIGLKEGNVQGAMIERGAHVGTGAKIIGPVTIGVGAKIGANAVVVHDVPNHATAVGAPARVLGS